MLDACINRGPLTRFAIVMITILVFGITLPLTVLSWSASAQNSSGQLVGTVSNIAGEIVPRATVNLSTSDGRTQGIAITDSAGRFVFAGIPEGTYVLQVFGNGFGPSPRTNIELRADRNVMQDVTLDIVLTGSPERSVDSPRLTRQYTGELVSIDVNDLDIRAFFRWCYEVSGITIVVDADARERLLDRSVTVDLKGVPWDRVLDVVLTSNGLKAERGGDSIRIGLTSVADQ